MRKVLKWTGIVFLGLVVLSVVVALVAPAEDENDEPETAAVAASTATEAEQVETEATTVTDVEGNTCKADETKYGRCPSSPDYGKTMVEARKAKAARAKAERARLAAARAEERRKAREEAEAAAEAERLANAWKQGFEEVQDGIAIKWERGICDNTYYTCFGMRLVTRDGCDSLFVTLQLQDSAGNAIGTAIDSATALQPGQVALLDFTAFEENVAHADIAEINCY